MWLLQYQTLQYHPLQYLSSHRNQPLQGSAHPKQQAEQAATPKEIEKVAERYNHRTFATQQ